MAPRTHKAVSKMRTSTGTTSKRFCTSPSFLLCVWGLFFEWRSNQADLDDDIVPDIVGNSIVLPIDAIVRPLDGQCRSEANAISRRSLESDGKSNLRGNPMHRKIANSDHITAPRFDTLAFESDVWVFLGIEELRGL